MTSALPFILASLSLAAPNAAVAEKQAATGHKGGARIMAVAQAEIITAEKISYTPSKEDKSKTDRQFSKRGEMPMVEFY